MERSQREKLTEELTLVLLYLTSFTEKQCPNVSELLGVAYTQIRNPDSNLSLLGRS